MKFSLSHSLAAALLLANAGAAQAEPYRIGPQDRIALKVVEWRGAQGTLQEWTAVGGEYIVSAEGTISVPLVGAVAAEGKAVNELGEIIAVQLQQRLGLTNRPDASVEIREYRPVFVLGVVEKPGPYPYQPGLTALKALGLAGGFYRPPEGGTLRLARDSIAAGGDVQAAALDARRLLVRRARLKAELAGAGTFAAPDELGQAPDIASLVDQEQQVMASRAATLKAQLRALADSRKLFEDEVVTLDAMVEICDKQIGLARGQQVSVNTLAQKGLAVNSRQYEVTRIVADLESKKLEAQDKAVRARAAAIKADHDATELRNDFQARVAADLVDAEGALKQARAKLETARSLVEEAAASAGAQVLDREDRTGKATYAIIRNGPDGPRTIEARETTPVLPGDVVRVALPATVSAMPRPAALN